MIHRIRLKLQELLPFGGILRIERLGIIAFKETVTAVVVKNAVKYARKDFDKNAPHILSLMEMADVKKVNRSTYAG